VLVAYLSLELIYDMDHLLLIADVVTWIGHLLLLICRMDALVFVQALETGNDLG
jgi:hypothetical protein